MTAHASTEAKAPAARGAVSGGPAATRASPPAEAAGGPPAPTVSVVICVHTLDRWADIREAVDSVRLQVRPAQEIVVVVDHNAALLDRCRTFLSGVTVVENLGPRGLSAARNTGVAVSTGRIVAFLDDDAVAGPNWLAAVVPLFGDASVGGVGSAAEARWVGVRPRWLPDEFLWVVGCAYRGLEAGEVRNGLGCAMAMRRSLFERVGGFDPRLGRNGSRLPISCEETEFSVRAAKGIPGARFVYAPEAGVAHKVPADRLTFAYFVLRCFAEGVSKARVARIAGATSLATERRYVLSTLAGGVARGSADALVRRDVWGGARTAAIAIGLGGAIAGYAWERLGLPAGSRPHPAPAAPAPPTGRTA